MRLRLIVVGIVLLVSSNASADRLFGEVEGTIGATFPEGSFSRYADAGLLLNGRATIHVPAVEILVAWTDFSWSIFSDETIETQTTTIIPGGPIIITPVDQRTTQQMFAGHIGLQLASPSRRGFFRPRAALGVGLYHFRTDITWTDKDGEEVADLTDDAQTSWGWRGIAGFDLFINPKLGLAFNYLYDHVFDLNQQDAPDSGFDQTARFQGFSVGVVYMFSR